MNYENIYISIIERARHRELSEYTEKHHIIPKCMGGDNSSENLVKLTPEEHYLAHQLLVKIYPMEHKLSYACLMMTRGSDKHVRNNKLYGWLRRKLSESIRKLHTGKIVSLETRQKLSESAKSRVHTKGWKHTDETKRKMSLNHKHTQTRLGAVLSDETKNKMRIGNLNKQVTDEFRKQVSKRTKGELNPMYGRKHSDTAIEKIRNAKLGVKMSDEVKSKMSASRLGKSRGKYIESICPHCNKIGSGGNMKRYHFDNCKEKKN